MKTLNILGGSTDPLGFSPPDPLGFSPLDPQGFSPKTLKGFLWTPSSLRLLYYSCPSLTTWEAATCPRGPSTWSFLNVFNAYVHQGVERSITSKDDHLQQNLTRSSWEGWWRPLDGRCARYGHGGHACMQACLNPSLRTTPFRSFATLGAHIVHVVDPHEWFPCLLATVSPLCHLGPYACVWVKCRLGQVPLVKCEVACPVPWDHARL